MLNPSINLPYLSGETIAHKIDTLELDFSRKSCFDECPRKYFFQYVKHLKSADGSAALRFGSTLHAMLEGYYYFIGKTGWGRVHEATSFGIQLGKAIWDSETESTIYKYADYRSFEAAVLVFLEYVKHFEFEKEHTEVVSTEEVFEVVMGTANTEEELIFKKLTPFLFVGKVDLKLNIGGAFTILDHKTTSMAIDATERMYRRSPQPTGYTYGEYQFHGKMPAQTLMNFLHISHVKTKPRKLNPSMISIPLGKDLGMLKVEFARAQHHHTEYDMKSWRLSMLKTAQDVQWNMQTGLWPLQYSSCMSIFGACVYTDLCEQCRPLSQLNINGYIQKEWNPRTTVDLVAKLKKEGGDIC